MKGASGVSDEQNYKKDYFEMKLNKGRRRMNISTRTFQGEDKINTLF